MVVDSYSARHLFLLSSSPLGSLPHILVLFLPCCVCVDRYNLRPKRFLVQGGEMLRLLQDRCFTIEPVLSRHGSIHTTPHHTSPLPFPLPSPMYLCLRPCLSVPCLLYLSILRVGGSVSPARYGRSRSVKMYHGNETLEETVRTFRGARVLIAAHGGGQSNMLFMPPGGAVVEVRVCGSWVSAAP